MNSPYEVHRHARQFVLGPPTRAHDALTQRLSWNGRDLQCHPWLQLQRCATKSRELLLLGHVLDPDRPELDNRAVTQALFGSFATFHEFEAASARLGGRWIAFVRLDNEARLYPDAAGMRSVFFSQLPGCGVVLASQPQLLADVYDVRRDGQLDAEFHRHPHSANSWPCELTPYTSVRQLLPNHYLNLSTGAVVRFWPCSPPETLTVQRAAEQIAAKLHGFIAATLNRGATALALTAGYDSRTLYSSAQGLRNRLTIFRVDGNGLPSYDRAIPRRLTRRFGGHLMELIPQACPPPLQVIMQENVAGLWSDPGAYMLYSFGALNARYVLLGQLSEIARCFYYRDGRHPKQLDAASLARAAHYGNHPLALAAFERWLSNIPVASGVAALDLFYWEHRAGNWASLLATASDTFFDPIAPYNCRALLEVALGVDVMHRRAPYALHRLICETATTGTAELPFNFSWRDMLTEQLMSRIPWRVRGWLRANVNAGGTGAR